MVEKLPKKEKLNKTQSEKKIERELDWHKYLHREKIPDINK